MAKYLVIVESPAKAKTIKKFLGSNYKIEASFGHVRDLPKSQLGIDYENDFEPKYITIRGKGDLLAKLRKEAASVDKIYLATDPDREGEAISWHLKAALKLEDKNFSRITFNEITKSAVQKSIKNARDLDMALIDAQQARRVLDRMVGYSISRLLWTKVKKGLSAGRVQSVALHLLCEREDEINRFVPEEYWTVEARLVDGEKKPFTARLSGDENGKLELKTKAEADAVLAALKQAEFEVTEVKTGTKTKNPPPPFITSTLQQDASRYLGLTAQKTMMVVQQLYEGVDIQGEGTVGLVSYIRTDSTRISDEAYENAKAFIGERLGAEYLPKERMVYASKKRAQDAHEAIRPTNVYRLPEAVKDSLNRDQYRLYKLIWERFVASQMAPAQYKTDSVKIQAGDYRLRSGGDLLTFPGFLSVYKNVEEDPEAQSRFPSLQKGDTPQLEEVTGEQHFTQPPPRYTDASLIKTLEEIGVGRPSTFAPTLSIIQNRNYVVKENKAFYTTELGEVVNEIMVDYFPDIADSGFTAHMEEELDEVEDNQREWKQIIRDFYPGFSASLENAQEKLSKVEIKDEVTDVICEKCGRNMVIKYGRYGKFLACPGFPECQNAKPLLEDAGVPCPVCGGKVLIKKTKKGRKYYACEHQPDACSFISWNKPSTETCPVCGSYLEERGKKNPKLVCSNTACGYSRDKEEAKTGESAQK